MTDPPTGSSTPPQESDNTYVAGLDVDLMVADTLLRARLREVAAEHSAELTPDIPRPRRRRAMLELRRDLFHAAGHHDRDQRTAGRLTVTARMRQRALADVIIEHLDPGAGVHSGVVRLLVAQTVLDRTATTGIRLSGPGAWPAARALALVLHHRQRPGTPLRLVCTAEDYCMLTGVSAATYRTPATELYLDVDALIDAQRDTSAGASPTTRPVPQTLLVHPASSQTTRLEAVVAAARGRLTGILVLDQTLDHAGSLVVSADGILQPPHHTAANHDLVNQRLFIPPGPTGHDVLTCLAIPTTTG